MNLTPHQENELERLRGLGGWKVVGSLYGMPVVEDPKGERFAITPACPPDGEPLLHVTRGRSTRQAAMMAASLMRYHFPF